MSKPLFIPVILGTARKGRRSENAARFVFEETKKRAGVETEFVDICKTNPIVLSYFKCLKGRVVRNRLAANGRAAIPKFR